MTISDPPLKMRHYTAQIGLKVRRETLDGLRRMALDRGVTVNDLAREILDRAVDSTASIRTTSGMKVPRG